MEIIELSIRIIYFGRLAYNVQNGLTISSSSKWSEDLHVSISFFSLHFTSSSKWSHCYVTGFNCGEAANFATPQWLKFAKEAAVRRAVMNYLPMLSHQQLLYLLAVSFISR